MFSRKVLGRLSTLFTFLPVYGLLMLARNLNLAVFDSFLSKLLWDFFYQHQKYIEI